MVWDNIDKEVFPPDPDRYYMANWDKDSLNEIKKMLKENKYKDKATVDQHIKFLEQLAEKLRKNIDTEKKSGNITWSLERDFEEVKKTFNQLYGILERL